MRANDAHLVSQRLTGEVDTLAAYDSSGNLLWRDDCLLRGVNGGYTSHDGDTVPGRYRITKYQPTTAVEDQHIWKEYGVGYYWLEECEGQESRYGRAGQGIHGGGSALGYPGCKAPRQRLVQTLGCTRTYNELVTGRLHDLFDGVQSSGGTLWYDVHQEAAGPATPIHSETHPDHPGGLWYPKASREHLAPVSGDYVGGPPRGVIHTTEGDSAAGAIAAFSAAGDWPHFTVSYEGGKFQGWQHLPVNQFASALEHRPGTVETNRQHAIQIECVGHAATSRSWDVGYLDGLSGLMRWIESNAGVARSSSVTWVGSPDSVHRLGDQQWLDYSGWCGHQHVPNQEHWDPGSVDMRRLLG